jgi:hypothetical protein
MHTLIMSSEAGDCSSFVRQHEQLTYYTLNKYKQNRQFLGLWS